MKSVDDMKLNTTDINNGDGFSLTNVFKELKENGQIPVVLTIYNNVCKILMCMFGVEMFVQIDCFLMLCAQIVIELKLFGLE